MFLITRLYPWVLLLYHVLLNWIVLISFKLSTHYFLFLATEITISSLTLASRTATTLSVTWSAGYPKCYSFTVSHSTQDGSNNVTQPANSDTSHTLTSLQPGTTYRIEVEAARKGDRADRQRAKVMGNFATDIGESYIEEGTVQLSAYTSHICMVHDHVYHIHWTDKIVLFIDIIIIGFQTMEESRPSDSSTAVK